MLVKFLQPTPYTPKATDSPRCYGQLRLRQTVVSEDVSVEVSKPDGTTETVNTTQTKSGAMEKYFPVGATPELDDEAAMAFVTSGVAEVFVSPDVASFVSTKEILQDIKAD